MTDQRLAALQPKFAVWFMGDPGAIRFASDLWVAAQEWDDLQDEGAGNHNAVLNWLGFEAMRDPFLSANAHVIKPALLQMYLDWMAANTLEKGSESDIDKAWMLRAGLYRVYHAVSWLIGGHEHALECGPDIWRTYGETKTQFQQEMAHA